MRVLLHDGREELTGWLNQEQLTQSIAGARAKSKTLWLQERRIICVTCPDREQGIMEYPVGGTESARYRPRGARYLAAGSRPL